MVIEIDGRAVRAARPTTSDMIDEAMKMSDVRDFGERKQVHHQPPSEVTQKFRTYTWRLYVACVGSQTS